MQFLSDDAYNSICSFHSDSAISFAVFLHHLPNMHVQHSPDVLIKAMQVSVQRVVHTTGMSVEEGGRGRGPVALHVK